ncbi:MAG: PEP-CTERM sorting domain-containing protein [Gammaproteobacteria bacterium]
MYRPAITRPSHEFHPSRSIARGLAASAALGVGLLAAGLQDAGAVALLYNDFSSLNGLQVNGQTAVIHGCAGGVPNGASCGAVTDFDGNKVLRLTNNTSQGGSAFSTTAIALDQDASFSTAFRFRFSDQQNGGADGIVFTVQTNSNTSGGIGGGIGYQGLQNSVGIEFDNWFNGGLDPNGNHVGIDLDGDVNSKVTSIDIADLDNPQNIFTAWVDYDGVNDLLEVRVNTTGIRPVAALLSYTVDLVSVLGQTDAFVGFTSGTGFAGADHDILSWQFNSTFDPIDQIGDVPEPAGTALLGIGLLGAARLRRRHRA